MTDTTLHPAAPGEPERPALADDEAPLDLGHPTGTLVIVALYGLLFAAGWIALYVFEFLPRGAPH